MERDMAVARTVIAALLVFCTLAVAGQPAFAEASTGTIVVTVQDQNGSPISAAQIEYSIGGFYSGHNVGARIGPGVFSVSVPSDTSLDLCAQDFAAAGASAPSACAYGVRVPPGGTLPLTLVLNLAGSGAGGPGGGATGRGWIFGRVSLAGTGAAVPGITVALASTPLSTRTAADGSYQFPALSTTDGANGGPVYTVSVTPPPGYTVVGNASQQVTVQADHGADADFTLQAVPCRFVLGFQMLHDAIPAVVGDCADDEQHAANGDGLQHTTHGLLVWRKADNFTAFTDGYRSWVNGPNGIQERLNTQRFAWEANPGGLPVVP
jgi:hypothetical protein